MTRSVLPVLAVFLAAHAGTAQQVLEIDYDAGRAVINDQERAFYQTAIDHERAVLYLYDLEEPEGVMAFSMVTGERLHTIRFSTGDGPRELPTGFSRMSVGTNGGLYVSDLTRVLEFDAAGRYVSNWAPRAPQRKAVCAFGGQPAVPTFNGVVRRTSEGEQTIGPGVWDKLGRLLASERDLKAMADRIWDARITCTDDAAYVVTTFADDTDSLEVHHRSGGRGSLPLPPALAEAEENTGGPTIFTDGKGNLVLTAIPSVRLASRGGYGIAGAVLDPQSGCHAIIRNPEVNQFQYSLRGIYGDSAVVAVRYVEEGEEMGRRAVTFFDHATSVFLHPMRRVSGEPCPGMLPGVGRP